MHFSYTVLEGSYSVLNLLCVGIRSDMLKIHCIINSFLCHLRKANACVAHRLIGTPGVYKTHQATK